MKQIHGAENVADLTIGNPFAPPPEALLRALEEVVARPSPDLHRYTASAGHPEVRERIAAQLDERGLLPGARRRARRGYRRGERGHEHRAAQRCSIRATRCSCSRRTSRTIRLTC